MKLKDRTTHVVIEFAGSHSPGQRKEVDLVPASWLTYVNDKWKCKYPPKKDYSKRTSWTKKSRRPNPEWLAWTVNIIKEAKNYDEGIRRLQRSYDTSNVDSTSAAEDYNHEPIDKEQEFPQVLDENEKNAALKRAPVINETITEHETGSSGTRNAKSAACESSTSTDGSSEIDKNERTIIHYTERQSPKERSKSRTRSCGPKIRESDTSSDEQNSSPPRRKKKNLKRSAADTQSSEERGPSPPSRGHSRHRTMEPPVTSTDSSSDEQRPSPPPKKKRQNTQSPAIIEQRKPHVPAVTEQMLAKMEKRILKKVESAKRSVLYDINIKVEQLKNTMVLNSEKSGMNIVENRKCLNIELPVGDPVVFAAFDEALRTAPDKEKALKCIMTTAITGVDSGNKAVASILKSVLGKSVQEAYSACGRVTKGIAKKNFSITKTYSCMQDVVCDNHNITKENILSLTSRWLSGCVDRDGGRVRRAAALPIGGAAQVAPIEVLVPPVPAAVPGAIAPAAAAVLLQAEPAEAVLVQQPEP